MLQDLGVGPQPRERLSTASQPPASSDGGLSTAAIVGIAAGAVAITMLLCCCAAALLLRRRRSRAAEKAEAAPSHDALSTEPSRGKPASSTPPASSQGGMPGSLHLADGTSSNGEAAAAARQVVYTTDGLSTQQSSEYAGLTMNDGVAGPVEALEDALDALFVARQPFMELYDILSSVERRTGGQAIVQVRCASHFVPHVVTATGRHPGRATPDALLTGCAHPARIMSLVLFERRLRVCCCATVPRHRVPTAAA